MMENLYEKQLNSDNVFKGKLLDVYRDEIELPNGRHSVREYIKHVGAAAVVPVDEDGNVIMIRQFRYPFARVLLEIPAGKLDSKNEPPLEAAVRELKEETGYTAENIVALGEFYPTCAYADEVIHLYLATGLKKGQQNPDDDEFVEEEKIPLEELVREVMSGKIKDGKTQTAILKAYIYLNNK